jgi:hypothetical protein
MSYWKILPEVAGELGGGTVLDTSVHPPRVHRLEHRFEGWLGDDLLECFPCFLVTERLASAMVSAGLCGFELDTVDVSTSPEFEQLYPRRKLPRFQWLKVHGREPNADLRLSETHELIVSDRCLEVLRSVHLKHARIEPVPQP